MYPNKNVRYGEKNNALFLLIDLFLVIVVHEIPVKELYQFLFDETKAKETTLMFGVMWFLHKKGRLP
jgi:hypothetical protein